MNSNPDSAGLKLIQSLSRPIEPVPTGLKPILPKLPGIRCVIFDVYGTLLASTGNEPEINNPAHRESTLRTLLRQHGIPAPSRPSSLTGHLDALIVREHEQAREAGIPFPEVEIRDLWSELLQHPRDKRLEELAIAYECMTNPVWPMPGARELLAALHEREFILGIISNAQFYTPLLFPALLNSDLASLGFTEALCLFSYRFRNAKPGLALYETMKDCLSGRGIQPHEALYVGNDAEKDIHPASETGFRTALFAGDLRSLRLHQGKASLQQPDALLTELDQIIALLPEV